jgi:endonuclease/exonuclease/phosphatase family metal-dependent hydrolase
MNETIRIVTYNVHKCRGLDRRELPERIAATLRRLNADVIALQEVIGGGTNREQPGQAHLIANALGGYRCYFGENRRHNGAPYGNAVLSRLPIRFWQNYDLTWRERERRGCLRVDVEPWEAVTLHLFNVHLGTGFLERRAQARILLGDSVLRRIDLQGPSVVVGDFNEWTRGLASRLMSTHYDSVDLKLQTGKRGSYPGVFPFLHLDHFYFDRRLALKRFHVCRTAQAIIASDHLPIVADFALKSDRGPQHHSAHAEAAK